MRGIGTAGFADCSKQGNKTDRDCCSGDERSVTNRKKEQKDRPKTV